VAKRRRQDGVEVRELDKQLDKWYSLSIVLLAGLFAWNRTLDLGL
jgi:hypothetical protein